jgi:hypothetical protein
MTENSGRTSCVDALERRRIAMIAIVGMWKDREDIGDPVEYMRGLRRDDRLERLLSQE